MSSAGPGSGPVRSSAARPGNTVAAAATVMAEVAGPAAPATAHGRFALTDLLALGALTAARTGGVAVPGGLSVVGFDDIAEATASSPPLTTVSQPLFRIGQEAARIALLQLAVQRGLPPWARDRTRRPRHHRPVAIAVSPLGARYRGGNFVSRYRWADGSGQLSPGQHT